MIQIDSVTIQMGQKKVLDSVSAELPPCLNCIIGPNGAGKTLLMRAMAGLLTPADGRILLDGEDIFAMDRKKRAKKIAYLPQVRPIPQIEARLLVEHGRHPYNGFSNHMDETGEAAVENAMRLTNTLELADKKLTQLSGGERQRVYIAAALAQDTDVLLLDEPTTYLDLSSQLELMHFVRSISHTGKTVVMIMHDIVQAFSFADRVLVIDNGKFLACAAPHSLCGTETIRQICGCIIIADPRPNVTYRYRLAKD